MNNLAASENTAAADLEQSAAPEPAILLAVPAPQPEDAGPDQGAPTTRSLFPSSIIAFWPDGSLYSGDLLGDIVRYRDLRSCALAGSCMTADDTSNLTALEMKVRQPARPDCQPKERRFFRRYSCAFDAEIEYVDGPELMMLPVTVEDISAGGVKIRFAHLLEEGQRVQFRVEVAEGATSDVVVFPARVAWTSDDVAGLMFAGAAIRVRV